MRPVAYKRKYGLAAIQLATNTQTPYYHLSKIIKIAEMMFVSLQCNVRNVAYSIIMYCVG